MLIATQCDLQKFLIPTKMNFHLKTSLDDPLLHAFDTGIMPEMTLNYTRSFRSCIESTVPEKEDPLFSLFISSSENILLACPGTF